jgi:hypothetical protein
MQQIVPMVVAPVAMAIAYSGRINAESDLGLVWEAALAELAATL